MARVHAFAAAILIGHAVGPVNALPIEEAAAQVSPSPNAFRVTSCTLPDLTQPARCGVLNVPEDPARPAGRQLAIHFVVIPATGTPASPDPIVPLMGGPGEDAISAAAIYAAQFASLRTDRDLLLVDQRGAGQSAALSCHFYSSDEAAVSLRDVFPLGPVERCKRELQAHADLRQYGYLRFASDLEQIRRALGYESLNLFASSYGTRAAVVYLRAYPASIRTAYLGSVVPIDIAQPLPMARTEQEALDSTLKACLADSACHRAFPALRMEFSDIAAQLTAGVRISTPGTTDIVPLARGRVAEWLRATLYRPENAAKLPWLIHQAYIGNWTPIVEGILAGARNLDSDLNLGLLLAITCNEDLPFIDDKEILRETQGTFLGDYRVRQQKAACAVWPRSPLPVDYRRPVISSVPTMFVSGDSDGATPLWFMEHAGRGFEKRVEIVARGQGHTEWSDCISRLYQRFIISGSVDELMSASCEPVPRPSFKTG
jgi:pimeloyl-ACP methyl ester carboxylesterase